MTYDELADEQGREVAALMYAILASEPADRLVQTILDYMGPSLRSVWAERVRERIRQERV